MHAKQLLEVIQDCKIRIEYEEHVPLYKRYQEITTGTELTHSLALLVEPLLLKKNKIRTTEIEKYELKERSFSVFY